jgi:kynurenine formamidase
MCQGHHHEAPGPFAHAVGPAVEPPDGARLVDLTHPFGPGIPVADFDAPERSEAAGFAQRGFRNQRWSFVEHSGTHVDAPSHLFPGSADAAQIRPQDLVAPVVVLELAGADGGREPALGLDAVLRHEDEHGPIPPRAAVFLSTGWEARFHDPVAFANVGADGRRRAPGFGVEAVDWLITERDIACIGVDTISLDVGSSIELPVHRRLLGSGRYGIECLRGLSRLPRRGATAFVGLIPFEDGSGGPCRVLAWW